MIDHLLVYFRNIWGVVRRAVLLRRGKDWPVSRMPRALVHEPEVKSSRFRPCALALIAGESFCLMDTREFTRDLVVDSWLGGTLVLLQKFLRPRWQPSWHPNSSA